MAHKEHARLAPSSAERWISCPGSIQLCEKMPPEPDSGYALEGRAAHALAEDCLQRHRDPDQYMGEIVAEEIPQYPVTENMAEAVAEYLAAVRSVEGERVIEAHCDISWLHKGMFGTPDVYIYEAAAKTLHVFDYKHGAGVSVDAEWNPQLMIYALGACHDLYMKRQTPIFNFLEKVRLVVVQPRVFGEESIREWETVPQELYHWGLFVMRVAAKATESENAPRHPGSHCRFCRALAVCPEQIASSLALAKTEFADPQFASPEALTVEDIIKVRDVADRMKAWVDEVEAYMQARMERGDKFPGWKLVQRKSNRKWEDVQQAQGTFVPMLGQAAMMEPALRSPAQVEKLLKSAKLFNAESFNQFVTKPDNGLTVVRGSDRRAAVEPVYIDPFIDIDPMFAMS